MANCDQCDDRDINNLCGAHISLENPADVTVKMAFVLEVELARDISSYGAKMEEKRAADRPWRAPSGG